jgi:hypothetical protein
MKSDLFDDYECKECHCEDSTKFERRRSFKVRDSLWWVIKCHNCGAVDVVEWEREG